MSPKRTASETSSEDALPLCCFCEQAKAVVAVATPRPIVPRSRTMTTENRPYCLLHYYTTSAVRVKKLNNDGSTSSAVTILDNIAYQDQMPAMQSLFAEAFVQLQQQLSEAQARAANNDYMGKTKTAANDPLAILHHISKQPAKKRRRDAVKPPPPQSSTEGGFWREISTPQRLIQTQQAQQRKHAALVRRMQRAAAEGAQEEQDETTVTKKKATDLSARRRTSRKSIWNVLLDQSDGNIKSKSHDAAASQASATATSEAAAHPTAVCSSCGPAAVVHTVATHTARDVRKGEIWGSGQANANITRLQCGNCGRLWNEED